MLINNSRALKRILLLSAFLLSCFFPHLFAQTATVTGTVNDSTGKPIENAVVTYNGSTTASHADQKGNYSLVIPANQKVIIVAQYVGYVAGHKEVSATTGQQIEVNFSLTLFHSKEIIINGDTMNRPGVIPLRPFEDLPKVTPDVSSILVYTMGVTKTNEMSTQYSVRGGNFDENLVYVNDIEVYRPFLIRSGQQEGLSFVNTDMADKLHFSAGGFEANYGDKMSSVLDIHYREPSHFQGVASASLLGFNAEVEGALDSNYRFTYMIGIRNKSNRYLLHSLDTKGDYKTNFTDVQTVLNYLIDEKWSIQYLGNYAQNRYNLTPTTRETDFGTLNNALRFTVYFDGQEESQFTTVFNALSLNYDDHEHWRTKFILSSFNTYESETFDVQGQYYIDQLEADFGKPTFGQVAFNRGVGTFLNHGRNYLNAWVNSAEVKTWRTSTHYIWQFGLRYQNERIDDQLSEWSMVDSSGYSIPYLPTTEIDLQDVIKSNGQLFSNRILGYAQVKYFTTLKDSSEFSTTFGLRGNYWDFNKQFILSPRAQMDYRPHWRKRKATLQPGENKYVDIDFKLAFGLYDQPPFYRELRGFDGQIHNDVKAQTSVHAVVGSDLNFMAWGRPFTFTVEGYYKYLDNLIPYEVNDVRIRYYGENLSHGYAYGLDLRLNGKFVKGVDSWINISLLRTREDLYNDVYYIRRNAEGDTIIPGYTFDQTAVDSIKQTPGFIPRPTDQLLTFALFFQDYLPALPDCKMNLGLILGTGLPFGPPTHERYKAVFRMPPYRRVDIGFSYQIIKDKKPLPKTNPFHFMKSLWVGVDVFNLLQVQNTLSYYWVKDVTGRSYAIPNYLTNRQLSVRMIVHF